MSSWLNLNEPVVGFQRSRTAETSRMDAGAATVQRGEGGREVGRGSGAPRRKRWKEGRTKRRESGNRVGGENSRASLNRNKQSSSTSSCVNLFCRYGRSSKARAGIIQGTSENDFEKGVENLPKHSSLPFLLHFSRMYRLPRRNRAKRTRRRRGPGPPSRWFSK